MTQGVIGQSHLALDAYMQAQPPGHVGTAHLAVDAYLATTTSRV